MPMGKEARRRGEEVRGSTLQSRELRNSERNGSEARGNPLSTDHAVSAVIATGDRRLSPKGSRKPADHSKQHSSDHAASGLAATPTTRVADPPVASKRAPRAAEPTATANQASNRSSRAAGLACCVRTSAPVTRTITIHVPLAMQRRGGRKLVLTPDGTPAAPPKPTSAPSTSLKALARAYRWQHLLESGEYSSIAELAAAEKINDSYVCRLLRLTLLAPSIVQAILNGRGALSHRRDELLRPLPAEWDSQESILRH